MRSEIKSKQTENNIIHLSPLLLSVFDWYPWSAAAKEVRSSRFVLAPYVLDYTGLKRPMADD